MTAFRRVFKVLAVGWLALLPIAPLLIRRPEWASSSFGHAVAYLVYRVGSLVCHQRPERSFQLLGVALPVCARCTGIYLGAALASIGVSYRDAVRRRSEGARPSARSGRKALAPTPPPDAARTVLLWAMLPTAATLVFEWSTGRMPAHWIRAVSGAPLGAAVAWIVSATRALGRRTDVIH